MSRRVGGYCAAFLLMLLSLVCAGSMAAADEMAWRVGKASGDVWVTTSGAQQASLTDQTVLKPGDNIRTGRNGRALLVRGEETMLIGPNSIIGISTEPKDGLATIIQQAGSVLIEVEKRDTRHFQVETPYLAAVVKGTRFRVSVSEHGAGVDVLKGSVEVADFKSGQHAVVLPGQTAKVSTVGPAGLSLSGAGTLNPIQQGEPRTTSVKSVPVPKGGLLAPRTVPSGQTIHALGAQKRADVRHHPAKTSSALRIAVPLGEVRLNFHKVTNGLARTTITPQSARAPAVKETVWNSGELTPGNGVAKSFSQSNSNASVTSTASSTSSSSTSSTSNGNGNANGNGNGNGNGNANANAHNNGNGNGNGHGKGKGKG